MWEKAYFDKKVEELEGEILRSLQENIPLFTVVLDTVYPPQSEVLSDYEYPEDRFYDYDDYDYEDPIEDEIEFVEWLEDYVDLPPPSGTHFSPNREPKDQRLTWYEWQGVKRAHRNDKSWKRARKAKREFYNELHQSELDWIDFRGSFLESLRGGPFDLFRNW